jgi:hypothetical protein
VASHLESFKDLNSLVRTSHLFHGMFNRHLYRRAVAADRRVLDDIVGWVLKRCRLDSLTLLLDNGLSVNHTGKFDLYGSEKTMLRFLCRCVYPQECATPLARLLIQRGTDLEVKDENSETVIYDAIRRHDCDFVALLLAQGADPNAVRWGDNPVVLAAKAQDARKVNLLVAHGADINGRGEDGNTPLIVAILWQKYDIIPVLLAHGADVGVLDQKKRDQVFQICQERAERKSIRHAHAAL